MIRRLPYIAVLHFVAAGIALPPVVRAQVSEPFSVTAAVEARVTVDSVGCPTGVELWLLRAPDSIAGVEAALAWDRPDVAHFAPAASPERADSLISMQDSLTALLLPEGNMAVLDCEKGLLADWGFRQARLRTPSSAKVIAVADFLRPNGATPIPTGATGLLFRLPVLLQQTPQGAPSPDTLTLYLGPGQIRVSDKRGDLIDVVPPEPVTLSVERCPVLRPRR